MEPWTQHHSVVSMPRYAYNAGAILQRNAAAGFLVTCPFRREKSATKELLSLLREYMNLAVYCGSAQPGNGSISNELETCQRFSHPMEGNDDSKVQSKPSLDNTPSASNNAEETLEAGVSIRPQGLVASTGNESDLAESPRNLEGGDGEKAADSHLANAFDERGLGSDSKVFPIKLSTIGLVYICVPAQPPSVLLAVASKIMKDVEDGKLEKPQWCSRIYPIQGTCPMEKEELQKIASHLVQDYLRNCVSSEEPIDYAVAFNRRGDGTAASGGSSGSGNPGVLSRHDCIGVVTSAVEQVSKTIKVNLNTPQMVVLVELIPVSGTGGSLVCAVSVLPGHMTLSKPKLNIKPLAPLSPVPKKRKRLT